MPATLAWTAQPAAPGTYRAEISWQGPAGTGGAIASALKGWQLLRYEVTEEASPGCDGVRYSYTPTLGVFAATVSASGDVVVSETQLQSAMDAAANGTAVLEDTLTRLLGRAWDAELEPFRYAGEGAPVRWLHAG